MSKRISNFRSMVVMLFLVLPGIITFGDSGDNQDLSPCSEVVRANFGSGPDDIGNIVPEEANPEGPMSFAIGGNGEIYILDQLNSRIQVFGDNKRIKTIPITPHPAAGFSDIDITVDGKIVLLDNIIHTSVFILAEDGTVRNRIPLKGPFISKAADVSAVDCRDDGVWVRVNSGSVRIADRTGTPDPRRISVDGKFTRNGTRLIKGKVLGDVTVLIRLSDENKTTWRDIYVIFDHYICFLDGLDTDQTGNIYLGASLCDEPVVADIAVVLDDAGREIKRVTMYVSRRPEEIHRSFRVSPDGIIYQMALDDKGVCVRRFDP